MKRNVGMDTSGPGQANHGQALVIFVFAIVGLLAFVGLAVDGGTIFLERRRMQNAADAAARAGTRQLAEIMCDDTVTSAEADAAIWAEVVKYARNNGVLDPADNVQAEYVKFEGNDAVSFNPSVAVGNSLSGGSGVPVGAAGVAATARIERSTHLLTLIGIHSAGASAPAVAVTGPVLSLSGLRPFGVPLEVVEDLDPDTNDIFTISFKKDGLIYYEEKVAQHRGWMNLGYVWNQGEDDEFPRAIDESTDAKQLKEWMEHGWDGILYSDCGWFDPTYCGWGDFIHAKPGTNSSAICQAPEYPAEIIVPVYDYIPECQVDPIPDPKPACPTQGSGYAYHIVGFVGIKITDCNQGGGEITAMLTKKVGGEGQPSPNSGYGTDFCQRTALAAVTLWD